MKTPELAELSPSEMEAISGGRERSRGGRPRLGGLIVLLLLLLLLRGGTPAPAPELAT